MRAVCRPLIADRPGVRTASMAVAPAQVALRWLLAFVT